jgi:glycosyltransferase involved in cell wall biosynthesis
VRVAYFSPLPPQETGVAEYSANLLPHLAHLTEMTVFTDEADKVNPALRQQFSIRDVGSFASPLRERFDVCMYQMGNNIRFHEHIYATLLRYPGVTTLHDVNLHSFYGELLMKRGRVAAYTREMAYAYGMVGARHARQARLGLRPYDIGRYPLFDRVGHASLGVIVHSQYARRLVASRCPNTLVAHINQPVPVDPGLMNVEEAKTHLSLRPGDLLLASFGYLAPSKRVDVALRAFARIRHSVPNVHYALVGRVIEGYDLESLLVELDLGEVVRLVGYADTATFRTYLAATDIGINLRYPTNGETSATLLALMAAGKPTLVSRVDAFVELPEAACVKIDVGPGEQAQIEALLSALIEDRDLRNQIGANAADHVRRECKPEAVATGYINFIQQVLGEV